MTTNIPKDHPRYKSLMIREKLAKAVEDGLVNPTGLISHGRGEAFDYLMGEKSLPSALVSERRAAIALLKAKNPVVCVNGNAAALDGERLIQLAELIPAKVEVNIFHRTEERMELLISYLESIGGKNILGRNPDAKIDKLNHDRALCTKEGIFSSDVILVPIEDGDRAEALVSMGKIVISIDINPLSRTSKTATIPICDEISRALENIITFVKEYKANPQLLKNSEIDIGKTNNTSDTINEIIESLKRSE